MELKNSVSNVKTQLPKFSNPSFLSIRTIRTNKIFFLFKQLFEITLKRFPQGEKLRIYDGRGLFRKPIQAEQTKPDEDDFIKTIEGHVKKGYKVILLE